MINIDRKAPGVKVKKIVDLVAKTVASEGFEHLGVTWAKRPQNWWVESLGFSVETFRRYVSKPPFARECVIDPDTGVKVTLIRVGPTMPKTRKHIQNTLVGIWRAKTGLDISRKQYGHFAGMVDHWGDQAEEILKLVLSDVPAFMAGAKIEIAMLGDKGYMRYFNEFPPTSFILRFHQAGSEMYLMKQQAKFAATAGKPVSAHPF